MLSELSGLQESDERVWGGSKVSFTIETRLEEDNEIIQREYTFARAEKWDTWTFHEFEEKRAEDTTRVSARNWRRSRHIIWSDAEAPSVEVPPEVTEELEEMIGIDSMVLQMP